ARFVIDRDIVAALGILLGRRRVVGLPRRVLVIERRALGRRGDDDRDWMPPELATADNPRSEQSQERHAYFAPGIHRSPPISRSIAASWRCWSNSAPSSSI